MKAIMLAILFLAPNLGPVTAKKYAKIVNRESQRYKVDPFLIITIIHVETSRTWKPTVRSVTHDHGLMQVHVSTTTNSGLIGKEKVLHDPAVNIKYGTAILSMWRAYHQRSCKGNHPFWAHYKWGYKVGEISHALKVKRLYEFLKHRFQDNDNEIASIP